MSSPYIGEIRMFAGNFAPVDWAFCNGALMAIVQDEALFALIGTYYGGDGQTTFALPNLQSRFPVHMGQGSGLSNYVIGEMAGTETVTLTTSQIPAHTHTAPASSSTSGTAAPVNGDGWASPSGAKEYASTNTVPVTMLPAAVQSAGGNQPHDNMPPYLAVNFIIALFGIFPSQF